MTAMEEFISRESIRRFEAQLESSTDEAQKSTIRALLEAERNHLQEILQTEVELP